MIEFIAVIVFAVIGNNFYSENGFYPDPNRLSDALNSSESIINQIDGAFEYLAESKTFIISLLAFPCKIVIAQVCLFRESVLRAVFSIIADAGIAACLVTCYLDYTEKLQINELYYMFPMLACFIVIVLTFIGTESAIIPLSHIFLMLAEFIVVPLIMVLTHYSLKTILKWTAVIIVIVLAFAFRYLIGGFDSKASSTSSGSKKSGSKKPKLSKGQREALENRIYNEKKIIPERKKNLANNALFTTEDGVRKGNKKSLENIERWQKELDDDSNNNDDNK